MKKIIISLAITLIGVLVPYFLNTNKPKILYTLSDNIPINISTESYSQNVQQLVVKNTGKGNAERIIIDIKGTIIDYELIKYAEDDGEIASTKKDKVQIIYPSLPPKGSFKVVFKSTGDEIQSNDVKIKLNNGEAIYALENNSSIFNSSIFIIYILIMGIWSIHIISSYLKDDLLFKAKFNKYEDILKRKHKPFLINSNNWSDIKDKAFETLCEEIKKSRDFDIDKSEGLKILQEEKPTYLNNKEWDEILQLSEEAYENNVNIFINKSYIKILDLIKILKLNKPKYFDEGKWLDIRKYVLEKYQLCIENQKKYISCLDIYKIEGLNILQEEKPVYLSNEEWSKIREFVEESFENSIDVFINKPITNALDLIKILKLNKPKYFNEVKWNNIRNYALTKFKFIIENDTMHTYNFDIDIDKIYKLQIYEILSKDKPNFLLDKEWTDLCNYLSKCFMSFIQQNVHYITLYNIDKLKQYLSISRPQQFSESNWKTIMGEIYDRYIALKKQKYCLNKYTKDELIYEIKLKKPLELPENYWKYYTLFLQEIFNFEILKNIYQEENPVEYLKKQDNQFLIDVSQLEKTAYGVQLVNYYRCNLKLNYQEFLNESIPSWIEKSDYDLIKEYLEDKTKIQDLIDINKKENENLNKIKQKVTSQLEFINDLLTDSTVIDRVEDYNEMFAKGNFNNLKKVAKLLAEK